MTRVVAVLHTVQDSSTTHGSLARMDAARKRRSPISIRFCCPLMLYRSYKRRNKLVDSTTCVDRHRWIAGMMSGLATAANRWDWERIDIDDAMNEYSCCCCCCCFHSVSSSYDEIELGTMYCICQWEGRCVMLQIRCTVQWCECLEFEQQRVWWMQRFVDAPSLGNNASSESHPKKRTRLNECDVIFGPRSYIYYIYICTWTT